MISSFINVMLDYLIDVLGFFVFIFVVYLFIYLIFNNFPSKDFFVNFDKIVDNLNNTVSIKAAILYLFAFMFVFLSFCNYMFFVNYQVLDYFLYFLVFQSLSYFIFDFAFKETFKKSEKENRL